MNDPRIFFAAERTLLAWIRTGLTVMGFGFVIERFNLFLQLLDVQLARQAARPTVPHLSHALGLALVVLGAGLLFYAGYHHRRFVASLPADQLPTTMPRGFSVPVMSAWVLGVLGLMVAIHLGV